MSNPFHNWPISTPLEDSKEVPCSNCKGTGKVGILEGFEDYDREAACPKCDGKGKYHVVSVLLNPQPVFGNVVTMTPTIVVQTNTLYEITTGWTGESYERCYAWASDEAEAERLYLDKAVSCHRPIFRITKLFSAEDKSFVTNLSDCGWETDAE